MIMRKIFLLILAFIMSRYDSNGQSCDMYKVSNINVYLYLVKDSISTSRVDDSTSYSLMKLADSSYRVQKLLHEKVVEEHIYRDTGKVEYQSFKVRHRDVDTVYYINEKKKVCVLE